MNHENEQQMDQVLWPILSQKGPDTHASAEWHWFITNHRIIIDAE